jgi:hypothetical protein
MVTSSLIAMNSLALQRLNMLHPYIRTLVIALVCCSTWAQADEFGVEFSGFASLVASYSDDTEIGFSSNYLNESDTGWSLTRDSILGGQANISLTKNWDSVVQLVYQDRAYKGFDNFLELAFLRYRPSRDWAIRAGRLNSDLYLLSEYPHVGFAYLWTRPPHEYYSFASSAGHFDGVDVEYSQVVGEGFLHLKLATGSTTAKFKSGGSDFFIDFDDLITFSATYALNAWTMRLSVSKANLGSYRLESLDEFINFLNSVPNAIWPQAASLAQSFDTKNHQIEYAAFGVIYDEDNWLIQSEVSISESGWTVAPSNISAYISAGYRLNNVTLYTGISVAQNRHNATTVADPQFPPGTPPQNSVPIQQLALASQYVIDRTLVHQYSINVGAKWHISDNMVLKAQIDHFDIQPNGGGLWAIDDPADVQKGHRINLFSISTSVVF